jgi:type IV pilus assembly protein PilC
MLLFVVPNVTGMYSSMDLELPLPTRILIGSSNLLIKVWWVLLLILVGLVSGVKRYNKTHQGRVFFAKLSFKIPIVGKINMHSDLVEFSSTLSLLISSGVPILDALGIVSGSVKNQIYKDTIDASIEEVRRGVPLSRPLSQNKYIPQILPQMLAVGEETGKVDETLSKVAKYLQAETDQLIKNMTTAMEPIILTVLGAMVGFMVLAIIMPIYKLTSAFE